MSIMNKLENLKNELRTANEELEKANEKISRNKKSHHKEIKTFEAKVAKLETQNKELRKELEQMRTQNMVLEVNVTNLQDQNEKLNEENHATKRRLRRVLLVAMDESLKKRKVFEKRRAERRTRANANVHMREEEPPAPILHPIPSTSRLMVESVYSTDSSDSQDESRPPPQLTLTQSDGHSHSRGSGDRERDRTPVPAACRRFSTNVSKEITIRPNMSSHANSNISSHSSTNERDKHRDRPCPRHRRIATSMRKKIRPRGIHGKVTDEDGIPLKTQCKCGKKFKTGLDFRRHLNQKILNLVFYCDQPQCYARFYLDRDAKEHKIMEHGGAGRFPCNGCKMFFDSSQEVQRHRRHRKCHVRHIRKDVGYPSVREPDEPDVPFTIAPSDSETGDD